MLIANRGTREPKEIVQLWKSDFENYQRNEGGSDDDTPNEYALKSLPGINTTISVSLGYTDSKWGALLTSCDGTTITYDEIGNPLSYYNGSAYTFTWTGRRITSAVKDSSNMYFTIHVGITKL